MSQARKYVTRAEFDRVKEKADSQGTQLQVLTIRVEVLSVDMHRLTNQVADIAEDLTELRADVNELRADVNELRAEVKELRADMNAGFSTLSKSIADLHNVVLSAVMQLAPR